MSIIREVRLKGILENVAKDCLAIASFFKGLTLNSGEANETAVLAVLLNLNSIMFTPQGREALVNVFSLDGNISSLINFIELTG